ncbi:hypothetical protein BFP76_13480 [Amylibacter kogurei]|uniref:Uncharacterized protein n=1 Tax=Paramylibacter kogurei TaxID=1889778 RepID=A0A2G5K8W8_9RHOB|nr:hypothetical protein [Amylibacter kogurei]PIB25986.1 hypothetical protein BFP76_13480 [Amylibacter kogurei]
MANHKDDPQSYPALGRWLMFVDNPRNVDRICYALYGLCAFLVVLDFFYYKKVYTTVEKIPGFYAIYGFVMCALLVICAKAMRKVLMRDETYYAPYDVESEEFPEHDLDRESHDV